MWLVYLWIVATVWALVGSGWLLGGMLHWTPPNWLAWGPLAVLLAIDGLRRCLHAVNVQRHEGNGSERP